MRMRTRHCYFQSTAVKDLATRMQSANSVCQLSLCHTRSKTASRHRARVSEGRAAPGPRPLALELSPPNGLTRRCSKAHTRIVPVILRPSHPIGGLL